MGIFKKIFSAKELVVDPADLLLPNVVPTSKPGLSLKKAAGLQKVDIRIVGESFRVKSVAAVAKAAEGKPFDIYLVAEPTNEYDKNAVAVYAANLLVGYIGKPENKQWAKWVNDAFQNGELLWGNAKAITRSGTSNTGIFGGIFMPKIGQDMESIIPLELSDAALGKTIDKIVALSNSCSEPDTVAQLRSLSKKVVAVVVPLAAHAKWVGNAQAGNDGNSWNEILELSEEIFDNASSCTYATDEGDVDMVSSLEEFAALAVGFRPTVT